ncbi:MAG: hypothetical protein EXR62_10015 [Chloroflexi bacterium]|nr:hypothetical protein [Chloroflexota bacterium]
MTQANFFKRGILPGAQAGLIGGLLFGIAMAWLGFLPAVAALVRSNSTVVGFLIHLVIAASIGAGFGILVWHQQSGTGETLFWGLTYGALWWFIGPLTLLPIFLGQGLVWDIHTAQQYFPILLGHLWYGAITALALVAIRRQTIPADQSEIPQKDVPSLKRSGALLRGALAGLLSAWLIGSMLVAQGQLTGFSSNAMGDSRLLAWLAILLSGLLAGLGFAWLYPRPRDSAGAGLIRGTAYGFIWWVASPVTIIPLLGGKGLTWSVETVKVMFPALIAYLLLGAFLALFYQWLDTLVRLLFSDEINTDDEEGAGIQGLQAIGRGALAGLIGGLIFTLVMAQIGFLPKVASLIGSSSIVAGFIVHLIISDLIGSSYGLLFRRQSYDVGSALGWGVSYGFFWWLLGPLTLLPILLGVTPNWSITVAAGLIASLIGHLGYGAGLGIVYYLMEAHYSPWWIPANQKEAQRVARRKEQVLTSAPALWVLIVVIALTIPLVLGM